MDAWEPAFICTSCGGAASGEPGIHNPAGVMDYGIPGGYIFVAPEIAERRFADRAAQIIGAIEFGL